MITKEGRGRGGILPVALMYSLSRRTLAKRAWRSVAACPGATFEVCRCLSSAAPSRASFPLEKVVEAFLLDRLFFVKFFLSILVQNFSSQTFLLHLG